MIAPDNLTEISTLRICGQKKIVSRASKVLFSIGLLLRVPLERILSMTTMFLTINKNSQCNELGTKGYSNFCVLNKYRLKSWKQKKKKI